MMYAFFLRNSTATYANQNQQSGIDGRDDQPQGKKRKKIKAMCTYNKQHDKIKLNGEELEDIAKLHLSGQYHHSHWRYEGRYREPNKESQAGIPP